MSTQAERGLDFHPHVAIMRQCPPLPCRYVTGDLLKHAESYNTQHITALHQKSLVIPGTRKISPRMRNDSSHQCQVILTLGSPNKDFMAAVMKVLYQGMVDTLGEKIKKKYKVSGKR